MITRLTYGHKSASTLAKMSLEMINEYGADRCEMCNGAFSIINPDKSTIKNCHGVSHAFAYCCQYAYVDDIIVSANTKEEVTKIATYGAALRDKFCYRFKGVDIAGKVYDPSSETLDAAGELSVCGLRYDPTMETKFPTFHTGRKVRGKAVAPTPKHKNKKDTPNPDDGFIIREDFNLENLREGCPKDPQAGGVTS